MNQSMIFISVIVRYLYESKYDIYINRGMIFISKYDISIVGYYTSIYTSIISHD